MQRGLCGQKQAAHPSAAELTLNAVLVAYGALQASQEIAQGGLRYRSFLGAFHYDALLSPVPASIVCSLPSSEPSMRLTTAIVLCCAAIPAVPAVAQVKSAAAVKWGPGPDFLPHGARFAVIQGDPSSSGVYTIRLRVPDHYRFPPHFHPTDEHVTVLAGQFIVGMGDTVKVRSGMRLTAGRGVTAPAAGGGRG